MSIASSILFGSPFHVVSMCGVFLNTVEKKIEKKFIEIHNSVFVIEQIVCADYVAIPKNDEVDNILLELSYKNCSLYFKKIE